ncbi:MAG: (2Fe-2S) ferredoxin domain-containing protein [Sphaerochaetaceae bacterium]|nr:(2Fe-2S) ferredoxin domain-containing protein [Sphaerochaetaceae bacterium]MDX9939486.1 (2Fe-2S) ferredoxin domain-containing protein [Sphaerochaetaceae bacterium]
MNTVVVEICMGSSCFARGNAKALGYLESYVERHDLADVVELTGHLCLGTCSQGPNMRIDGVLHTSVRPDQAVLLLENALAARKGSIHG